MIPGGCCKMAERSSSELWERIARFEGLHVQLQDLQTLIEERINATNEKIDGVDEDMGILA